MHFISTRGGGVSEGKYGTLNLSSNVNDDPSSVFENRNRLANSLGIPLIRIVFPDQCHTTNIKEINSHSSYIDLSETDGLITRENNICLCILAADCVPVLLYDPVQHAIAALHAGWRGTCGQIVIKAIEFMVAKYRSNPEQIIACIGPAISMECYDVNKDVSSFFQSLFYDFPEIIWKNPKTKKEHIDLKLANSILLQRSGLKAHHIEINPLCTYRSPSLLFSARRDGIECGRFSAGIMMSF
jgi:YfiH family protein